MSEAQPPQPASPMRFLVVALVLLTVVFLITLPLGSRSDEPDFGDVVRAVREGRVTELQVVPGQLEVIATLESNAGPSADESAEATSTGTSSPERLAATAPTEELLTQLLQEVDAHNTQHAEAPIPVRVDGGPSPYLLALIQILPWLLFGGLIFWLIWRHQKNSAPGNSFGRSRARLLASGRRVTFADVAGAEEAKDEVYEVIEFLRDPQRFRRLGGRIPKGVLLVGPPGTGKTLLARAVAGEAGVPFFSISGSDFVEMFVGVGASRVRDLFREARASAPCIIFLDEIDAVGRRRSNSPVGGSEEREQTLNAILVEMDGFDSDSGVIVMAATNRPDVLDPALLRPGRFDREISVDLPDMRGRRSILEVHVREVPLHEEVDLDRVARGTPGFSGADLEALVNESALLAALEGGDQVRYEHMEEARDKVRWGRAKKSRIMEDEDRWVTAYHEAGHALLAHLVPTVEPLHKVTIIPRGPSLGSTMQLPERDQYHLTRGQAFGNLIVLLGGRIAEARFCKDISSGASNDLERVSELARRMVCEWGMSDRIGTIVYNTSDGYGAEESPGVVPLGEETRREIDKEVRRTIEEAYHEAEECIQRHAADIEAIAAALLEQETLTGEEVAGLIDQTLEAAAS